MSQDVSEILGGISTTLNNEITDIIANAEAASKPAQIGGLEGTGRPPEITGAIIIARSLQACFDAFIFAVKALAERE